MKYKERVWNVARPCLFYTGIIIVINLVVVAFLALIFRREIVQLFSLVTLVESGVGLTVGGILDLTGSASITKVKEYLFQSKEDPWTYQGYKERQKKANTWILTALILFVIGFFISILF